jgi:hypothetical protein
MTPDWRVEINPKQEHAFVELKYFLLHKPFPLFYNKKESTGMWLRGR